MANAGEFHEDMDCSLVLGGPLYQLLLRSRLTTPALELLARRIGFFVLVTWGPLALLAAAGGDFLGGVAVPFLRDVNVHAKFLISLPLFIAAELIVHHRLRPAVLQFRDAGLITPEDLERFAAVIRSMWRMRNSVVAEIVMLVLAFLPGHWLWQSQTTFTGATWYAAPANGAMHYTWAGYWYVLLSLPIVRFVILRWYFRIFIWYVLLWRVSRLSLRLNPLHPDRAGGLGFLGLAVGAFGPVLMGQTVMLAGMIGGVIWHQGAKLTDFSATITACIAILLLIALAPLGFFLAKMAQARRLGLRQYDLLGGRYVHEFRQKWLAKGGPSDPQLLGSGDIQSLADLANSYEIIREMKTLPTDRRTLISLAAALVLPLLPLMLTMLRMEEIVRRLVKIVL